MRHFFSRFRSSKNETITTPEGVKLTPFKIEDIFKPPAEMMAIPNQLGGMWVMPGHIDTYEMPTVGWVVAQYHGTMPNGDVILTIAPVEQIKSN